MPWVDVIWTDENEMHVTACGATRREAEHVLRYPDKVGVSRSSGRPFASALTKSGRRLIVVYEKYDNVSVYPVTAFFKD